MKKLRRSKRLCKLSKAKIKELSDKHKDDTLSDEDDKDYTESSDIDNYESGVDDYESSIEAVINDDSIEDDSIEDDVEKDDVSEDESNNNDIALSKLKILNDYLAKKDFKLESSMFENSVASYIKKYTKERHISLSLSKIKNIVSKSIKKSGKDIYEEYCHSVPSDKRWKIGLKRKRINKLKPVLKKCRKEIKKRKVTMQKILNAKIPLSDKREAVEKFDMLQNTEPYTQLHYDIEKSIRSIIECASSHKNIKHINDYDKLFNNTLNTNIDMKLRIMNLNTTNKIKSNIYAKYIALKDMDAAHSQYTSTKEWLRWVVKLPYEKTIKEETNIVVIRERLDKELYGMDDIKERVIEMINDRQTRKKITGECISGTELGLYGLPGCGKTSIAAAIAKALGIPYEKISLGGMIDSSILKGTDDSWVGASPSIILQIMVRMQCCNGLILFDEIDKLKGNRCENVQHALLHITDKAHNNEFQDTFISDFSHNLSMLWFMYAANDIDHLDSALKDRISFMYVKKYTPKEIDEIIIGFVLPKALKRVGLNENDVVLTKEALSVLKESVKKGVHYETSIRVYEECISNLVSKVNMLKTNKNLKDENKTPIALSYSIKNFALPITFNAHNIEKFLTKKKKRSMNNFMYM